MSTLTALPPEDNITTPPAADRDLVQRLAAGRAQIENELAKVTEERDILKKAASYFAKQLP